MRSSFIRTALAAAALVGVGSAAQAGLLVTLRDNTGVVITSTCDTTAAVSGTNCSTGWTINSLDKATFIGMVGNFSFADTVFQSNAPGSAGPLGTFGSTTNLNIFTNAANQQLTVDMIATGFTLPTGPIKNLSGTSSQSDYTNPVAGANQSYNWSILNDNLSSNFITPGVTLGSAGCGPVPLLVTAGGCAASTMVSGIGANFSLRNFATYNVVAANDTWQGSSTVRVMMVPEPASTALVGAALVALAVVSRRRKSLQA